MRAEEVGFARLTRVVYVVSLVFIIMAIPNGVRGQVDIAPSDEAIREARAIFEQVVSTRQRITSGVVDLLAEGATANGDTYSTHYKVVFDARHPIQAPRGSTHPRAVELPGGTCCSAASCLGL